MPARHLSARHHTARRLLLTAVATLVVEVSADYRRPLVYVYEIPEAFDVVPFQKHFIPTFANFGNCSESAIFGKEIVGGRANGRVYRQTAQHGVVQIILWRLMRSKHLTRNPDEADLYFVPMFPRPKTMQEWTTACKMHINITQRLPFLTNQTAHRHIFMIGKGHISPNESCNAWWRYPQGLLRRAQRFAYSSPYSSTNTYGPRILDEPSQAFALAADPQIDALPYPHLISIPYPSSIYFDLPRNQITTTPRSTPPPQRYYLASFIGGLTKHQGHEFAFVRNKIYTQCLRHPDHLCYFHRYSKKDTTFHRVLLHSTFCLEPGGDSPYRKGLYDAFLAGCIPVVFSNYNQFASPWHFWANHHLNSMVIINESHYQQDENFDLIDFLRSFHDTTIKKMQYQIALHSHRLQYSIHEYPDDAFDIILRGAWHAALARERLF